MPESLLGPVHQSLQHLFLKKKKTEKIKSVTEHELADQNANRGPKSNALNKG